MNDQKRRPMMKCGHTASGTNAKTGKPVCVCCAMINEPDASTIIEDPDLSGRIAVCSYSRPGRYGEQTDFGESVPNPPGCHGAVKSDTQLPFFEHCPDEKYDKYFCGCWGWD